MFAVTPDCPAIISTPGGDRPVETITPGSAVSLARGGAAIVRWTGQRRLRPARLRDPALAQPVELAAGALGEAMPHRDLRLSADHAVFAGLFVPVGLLVNGRTIRRLDLPSVRYIHVELDRHDAILAEGVAAETFVDIGNRTLFANAPVVTLRPRLPPPVPETFFTADWLAALRARLAAIADGLEQARAG